MECVLADIAEPRPEERVTATPPEAEASPQVVQTVWWLPIAEFIGNIDTAKLAIVGVIWYGFLAVTYDQFYRPLGINPSDIGLNYATLIATSVGTALVVLLPIALIMLVFISLVLLVRSRYRYGPAKDDSK